MALKPRADVNRSLKYGYHWPYKKNQCSLNLKRKTKYWHPDVYPIDQVTATSKLSFGVPQRCRVVFNKEGLYSIQ